MKELPKQMSDAIARHIPAGTHPEADLLTAFSEGSATAEERQTILAHLATCPECRDVLALAAPEEPQLAAIEPKPWAIRRWLWIPALAAVVVVAISTSVLIKRESSGVEKTTQAARIAGKPAAPSFPSDSKVERPRTNEVPVPRNAQTSTSKADKQPLATPGRQSPHEGASQEKRKQEVASDAVALGADRDRLKVNTEAARIVGGPIQPSPCAALNRARPAMDATIAKSQNETVDVQARSAAISTEQSELRTDKAAKAMHKEIQPPAAAPAAPVRSVADQTVSGAVAKNLSALAVPSQWRVTAEGQIERSIGNGPWIRALGDLAGTTTFRVVSVRGNHVWAGGNAGALFHSADNGEHWSRVAISEKAVTLASAIIGIQFQEAQHGTLQTDTDQIWTTSDGGAHWTRTH